MSTAMVLGEVGGSESGSANFMGIAGFDGLDVGAAAGKEGVGIGHGKGAGLAEAIPRGGR